MGSRNGLNPKIRAPKGSAFGRALPAPFSFGKGLIPPGTNNAILSITPLIGKTWPLEGSIEMWGTVLEERAQRELEITFNDGSALRITAYVSSKPTIEATGGRLSGNAPLLNGMFDYGTKYHYCFMWDAEFLYGWGSALIPNSIDGTAVSPISHNINCVITGAAIAGQVDGNLCTNTKMDELRFYNRKLSIDELVQNDNGGAGNNPSTTENIFAWYQFERFENLDFSALQDNSDIRLGIRDMSGKFNHAAIQGMDTDINSPTYVLKPF